MLQIILFLQQSYKFTLDFCQNYAEKNYAERLREISERSSPTPQEPVTRGGEEEEHAKHQGHIGGPQGALGAAATPRPRTAGLTAKLSDRRDQIAAISRQKKSRGRNLNGRGMIIA